MMRLLARAYLVVVIAAGTWAWFTEIAPRNIPSDHMLPIVVFGIVSWPTSAGFNVVDPLVPRIAEEPFTGLIALTLLAAMQAAFVPLLAHIEGRVFKRIEQSRQGDGSQAWDRK